MTAAEYIIVHAIPKEGLATQAGILPAKPSLDMTTTKILNYACITQLKINVVGRSDPAGELVLSVVDLFNPGGVDFKCRFWT